MIQQLHYFFFEIPESASGVNSHHSLSNDQEYSSGILANRAFRHRKDIVKMGQGRKSIMYYDRRTQYQVSTRIGESMLFYLINNVL